MGMHTQVFMREGRVRGMLNSERLWLPMEMREMLCRSQNVLRVLKPLAAHTQCEPLLLSALSSSFFYNLHQKETLSVSNQNNSICAAVVISRAGCSLCAEGWARLWAVLQGKWCSVFLRSGRALPAVPEQGSQQNSSPAQPPAQCAQLCRRDLNLHHERDLLWGRKYGLWRSKSFLA